MINAETFIPQKLLDYVESRRTELEIPVSTSLPFFAGIRDGAMCEPAVLFHCDAFECSGVNNERMILRISVTLINARDAEESATESAIAAKIRRALGDLASLKAWCQAMTEEEKAGWDIRKYRLVSGGIEIDPELAQRRRFTVIETQVLTSETNPQEGE